MKTPSTKVSLILFITVLVVVGTILFNENTKENNNTAEYEELSLNVDVNLDEGLIGDIDGDGLLDWEEALWGTDPLVADTDGDGTSDGVEVDTNRNPLQPGPDDENFNVEEKIIEELGSVPLDENSLTSRVGRDFVEAYFTLRSNNQLTPENTNALITSVINKTLSEIPIGESRYSESQFMTFSANDSESLELYANSFFNIMLTDADTFELASDINEHKTMSDILYNISRKLILLKVPEPILAKHAELTNNYIALSKAILEASKDTADPILSSINLYLVTTSQEKITTLTEDIGLFLNQSGIIYQDGEIKFKQND